MGISNNYLSHPRVAQTYGTTVRVRMMKSAGETGYLMIKGAVDQVQANVIVDSGAGCCLIGKRHLEKRKNLEFPALSLVPLDLAIRGVQSDAPPSKQLD